MAQLGATGEKRDAQETVTICPDCIETLKNLGLTR